MVCNDLQDGVWQHFSHTLPLYSCSPTLNTSFHTSVPNRTLRLPELSTEDQPGVKNTPSENNQNPHSPRVQNINCKPKTTKFHTNLRTTRSKSQFDPSYSRWGRFLPNHVCESNPFSSSSRSGRYSFCCDFYFIRATDRSGDKVKHINTNKFLPLTQKNNFKKANTNKANKTQKTTQNDKGPAQGVMSWGRWGFSVYCYSPFIMQIRLHRNPEIAVKEAVQNKGVDHHRVLETGGRSSTQNGRPSKLKDC